MHSLSIYLLHEFLNIFLGSCIANVHFNGCIITIYKHNFLNILKKIMNSDKIIVHLMYNKEGILKTHKLFSVFVILHL